jgi:hypothetical protein
MTDSVPRWEAWARQLAPLIHDGLIDTRQERQIIDKAFYLARLLDEHLVREAVTQPEPAATPPDTERLRYFLWANHGHDGLYGDDGEMQCGRCRADYLRDPLPILIEKAYSAAAVRDLEQVATPSELDPERHRCSCCGARCSFCHMPQGARIPFQEDEAPESRGMTTTLPPYGAPSSEDER